VWDFTVPDSLVNGVSLWSVCKTERVCVVVGDERPEGFDGDIRRRMQSIDLEAGTIDQLRLRGICRW
jgi:hypothetical protein